MRKNLLSRAIAILAVAVVCLYLIFIGWRRPTLADFSSVTRLKQNMANNVKLGLDLKGGSHLLMQVQADEVVGQYAKNNADTAKSILAKDGITVTDAKVIDNGQISVTIADGARLAEARDKLLADFGKEEWDARISGSTLLFSAKEIAADVWREKAVEQAMNIIENRINAFGVAEPTIQRYGSQKSYQILLQLPGVDDPERVKKTLVLESNLELRPVDGTPNPYPTVEAATTAAGGKTEVEALPYEERVTEDEEGTPASQPAPQQPAPPQYVLIEKKPIIAGLDIRDAFAVPADSTGRDYKIIFKLKDDGAQKFKTWTSANIGKYLAIVLNGRVKSAPVIRGEISDTGEISGNFTKTSSEDLALVLRSGALPARVTYVEERTVGPSLGADSIRQGVISSVAGLLFIMVFLLFYYRFSGVNALISLVLNLVMLLAALIMFGATLTLPGIAGVILTIGMAVDSNVLIFERIREEIRNGKAIVSAVETGFNKAFITIVDTHVTTVVSAVFLFIFGTGPIRGFAVTLIVGLLANIFTATFVSKTMFGYAMSRSERPTTLSI